MADSPPKLTGLVDVIEEEAEHAHVNLGDLVTSLGHVGFTALLFIPAIALATPLSGIPLFSTTMGTIIALVAAQMLIGRTEIWLPAWVLNREVDGARLKATFGRIRPMLAWLERRVQPRLMFLTHRPFIVIPQLLCLISGAMMPVLEFVPFSSSMVGLAIALLSLGM